MHTCLENQVKVYDCYTAKLYETKSNFEISLNCKRRGVRCKILTRKHHLKV